LPIPPTHPLHPTPPQSAFFFGFVEISSVPLVFVDLFRQFPALHENSPTLHAINEAARLSFAITFLIIR
jgi:hypothetical protein